MGAHFMKQPFIALFGLKKSQVTDLPEGLKNTMLEGVSMNLDDPGMDLNDNDVIEYLKVSEN